jgi:hypothetical protein
MRATLLGLEDYRLKLGDLRRLGDRRIDISVSLRAPDFKPLFPLPPQERNAWLHEFLSEALGRVRSRWPGTAIVPRGNNLPWTSDSTIEARHLPDILRYLELSSVFVEKIRGLRKKREPRQLSFFAVRGRVALQVEGQTEGLMSMEDRIVIVRAFSAEDAERRLKPEWESYGEPYLNSNGEMVRWHLVEIEDVYELDTSEIDPRGTEVYSRLSRHRVRPELVWNPRSAKDE